MPDAHDKQLTETIARHFAQASVVGTDVDLGVAGVHIRCRVNGVQAAGGQQTSASLFFELYGGELGPDPIFASVNGYGSSAEEAITSGGCNWACSFGPVLRASLGGEPEKDVPTVDEEIHGQAFRIFIDGLDRAVLTEADPEREQPGIRTAAARARFGARPWLISRLIASGRLPLIPAKGASVIGVFIFDAPRRRVVEIKVNGRNWPGADEIFADVSDDEHGGVTLLRELAVLIPMSEAPPLTRGAIEGTVRGLDLMTEGHSRRAIAWRGFRAHGGRLLPPLGEAEIAALEAQIGAPLPSDYRAYLRDVSGGGAGPGYGLLSPLGAPQRALAAGELAWAEGGSSAVPPRGALALAHAGCGNMWLLGIRGARAGEVWIDGAGSDLKTRRAFASFDAWYRGWLDAAVRDVADFCQWDARCCAPPGLFSQLLASLDSLPNDAPPSLAGHLGEASVRVASSDTAYFPPGTIVDPCQACVSLAHRLGVSDAVFGAGAPPDQAHAELPPPRPRAPAPVPEEDAEPNPPEKRGLLSRLFGGK
ncbi:MAG: SMI1/KNR4 family protein [Deltaproteobacteria bacterium]|nr:SMI1/KNR4 family protein [Deltaproteobacteria bacterium]